MKFNNNDSGSGVAPPAAVEPSQIEMIGLLRRVFRIEWTDLEGQKLVSEMEGHSVKLSPTGVLMVNRLTVIAGNPIEQCVEMFFAPNHYVDITPPPTQVESDSRIIH